MQVLTHVSIAGNSDNSDNSDNSEVFGYIAQTPNSPSAHLPLQISAVVDGPVSTLSDSPNWHLYIALGLSLLAHVILVAAICVYRSAPVPELSASSVMPVQFISRANPAPATPSVNSAVAEKSGPAAVTQAAPAQMLPKMARRPRLPVPVKRQSLANQTAAAPTTSAASHSSPPVAPTLAAQQKPLALGKTLQQIQAAPQQNMLAVYCAERPAPVYPALARRLRETGDVLVEVQLSSDGLVTAASILQSSGHSRLDSAALAAVQQWRCHLPQGAGLTLVVQQPFHFSLQR